MDIFPTDVGPQVKFEKMRAERLERKTNTLTIICSKPMRSERPFF